MSIRFLLVFDLLFTLFRIALWLSAGKELSPWLFTCVVFIFSVVLVVHDLFPFGVWGRMYWFLIIAFLSTLKYLLFYLFPIQKHKGPSLTLP